MYENKINITIKNPKDLIPMPEMEEILYSDNSVYEDVKHSIEAIGFDFKQPIYIYENEAISGRTVLRVAKELGINEVSCIELDSMKRDEAILYYLSNKFATASLTNGMKFKVIEFFDDRKKQGRPEKCRKQHNNKTGKTRDRLSKKFNICSFTIQQIFYLIDNADDFIKEQIRIDKLTINKAYNELKEKDKFQKKEEYNISVEKPEKIIKSKQVQYPSNNEKSKFSVINKNNILYIYPGNNEQPIEFLKFVKNLESDLRYSQLLVECKLKVEECIRDYFREKFEQKLQAC